MIKFILLFFILFSPLQFTANTKTPFLYPNKHQIFSAQQDTTIIPEIRTKKIWREPIKIYISKIGLYSYKDIITGLSDWKYPFNIVFDMKDANVYIVYDYRLDFFGFEGMTQIQSLDDSTVLSAMIFLNPYSEDSLHSSIVSHEFGHALYLQHSEDTTALMYKSANYKKHPTKVDFDSLYTLYPEYNRN